MDGRQPARSWKLMACPGGKEQANRQPGHEPDDLLKSFSCLSEKAVFRNRAPISLPLTPPGARIVQQHLILQWASL